MTAPLRFATFPAPNTAPVYRFLAPASHSGCTVTLYSPVVAASHLPGPLKDQVRDLLVGLGGDPAARPVLDHWLIGRFAPVADAAYDDIRAMLAAIEAAGWTSLTQTAVHP